jgi:hypothetical protein
MAASGALRSHDRSAGLRAMARRCSCRFHADAESDLAAGGSTFGRMGTILWQLAETGMRETEAVFLEAPEVDWQRQQITLTRRRRTASEPLSGRRREVMPAES